MEYQVRVTRVLPGRLDQFIAEWTATVARLRRRRGFTIVGAWAIDETNDFVWILGYDGDDGFAAADAAYYDSEERQEFDPDPARLIVSTDDRMGRRVV
jgi:hypothetical protein